MGMITVGNVVFFFSLWVFSRVNRLSMRISRFGLSHRIGFITGIKIFCDFITMALAIETLLLPYLQEFRWAIYVNSEGITRLTLFSTKSTRSCIF